MFFMQKVSFSRSIVLYNNLVGIISRNVTICSSITGPNLQKIMHDATFSIFTESNISKTRIDDYLHNNISKMSTSNLVSILYISAKSNFKLSDSQIELITNELRNKNDTFNVVDISNSLMGLKYLSADSRSVSDLLLVLAKKIQSSEEVMNNQAVGNSLYGLQSMSTNSVEVRSLLVVLTKKISCCQSMYNSIDIASCLFGMGKMNSKEWEVRDLIAILCDRIKSSTCVFESQEVSNCLYGLRTFSSEDDIVRKLIVSLTAKIKSSHTLDFRIQHISCMLYGMQGMNSNHVEVKALLDTLFYKIELTSHREFDSQAVGNALYGLQKMSSGHVEVRKVVGVLTQFIRNCRDTMDSRNISMALYGLRRMKNDRSEVVNLLLELTKLIRGCRKMSFTAQGVGNALSGLRLMEIQSLKSTSSHLESTTSNSFVRYPSMSHVKVNDEMEDLLRALLPFIRDATGYMEGHYIAGAISGLSSMTAHIDVVREILALLTTLGNASRDVMTSKDVVLALSALQYMTCDYQEVEDVLGMLNVKLKACNSIFYPKDIEHALNGLLYMTEEKDVVRQTYLLLAEKVNASHKKYYSKTIVLNLISISTRNKKYCEEINNLHEVLCRKANDNMTDLMGSEFVDNFISTSPPPDFEKNRNMESAKSHIASVVLLVLCLFVAN